MTVRLAAVAAVLAAALCASPARAADQATSQPGARIDEAPASAGDQLPLFDQAEIVRRQKDRLDQVQKGLRLKLVASESRNFLLFSDLDSRVRNAILIWLEGLREKVVERLAIPPDERLWDGKCLTLVFANHESLDAYARTFDNHRVNRSAGYFVLEARRKDEPRLVHIATFQPLDGGNEKLREVLVHETTHALIELYKDSVPLPLWLHEGLAEYMTVVMDPALRPDKQARAYRRAAANPYVSIRDVLTTPFPASDLDAYSVSLGLVETLRSIDPHGLLRFVESLKKRVEPEQALAQAYPGLDYAELERRWRTFCLRTYIPPAPAAEP